MTIEADVKNFPTCYIDTNEFTLVFFWAELRQSLVGHRCHSLESFYEFRSLRCTFLCASIEVRFSDVCFALSIIKKAVLH
jgi:hypothetical protein